MWLLEHSGYCWPRVRPETAFVANTTPQEWKAEISSRLAPLLTLYLSRPRWVTCYSLHISYFSGFRLALPVLITGSQGEAQGVSLRSDLPETDTWGLLKPWLNFINSLRILQSIPLLNTVSMFDKNKKRKEKEESKLKNSQVACPRKLVVTPMSSVSGRSLTQERIWMTPFRRGLFSSPPPASRVPQASLASLLWLTHQTPSPLLLSMVWALNLPNNPVYQSPTML